MSSSVNLLIVGASGYLGGTLLADLTSNTKYEAFKIFALVRKPAQVEAFQKLGVTPLQFNKDDSKVVKETLLEHDITAVVYLADGITPHIPTIFIEGLAAVKEKLGPDTVTHFLHPSGCKAWSSHAGLTPDKLPLSDLGNAAYLAHREQKAHSKLFQQSVECTVKTLELGDEYGVHTYVFTPATIYGEGRSFDRKLSGNQLVDHVRIGLKTRKMYLVSDPEDTWPIAHVEDCNSLTLALLDTWLPHSQQVAPHGREGVYFAIATYFNWKDVTEALAAHLYSKGLVDSPTLVKATKDDYEMIAKTIGCPVELVPAQTCGRTSLKADNGRAIGWEPKYDLEYLMAHIVEDTEHVLKQLIDEGQL